MAYKRELPTFNKDPEIQRTKVENPDGTITYKSNWSSTTPGASSSVKRTVKRTTPSASSSTRSIPATKTSGKREDVYIPGTKLAGIKEEKPVEVIKPQVKVKTRKEKFDEDKASWEKSHPGESWQDRYKGKKPIENKYVPMEGLRKKRNEKTVKLCKTCS